MTTLDAALSGTFSIGGDLTVNRLGFGAMRITGKGIWGPPEDPDEARATLRRLPELNVNFIDTAESYGPYVSEELIGEVLAPYSKGTIVTPRARSLPPRAASPAPGPMSGRSWAGPNSCGRARSSACAGSSSM